MSTLFTTSFVSAFTDIGATELATDSASTAWQLVIGVSAGIALIALALGVGFLAQRRGNAADDARKVELRAAADASGALRFTDLDLSDDSDFDLGVPASLPSKPSLDVPEYL